MFKVTNIVMHYAPIGVGAAIAYTVGHGGLGVLWNLAWLVATLYLALAVLILAVFVPIALIFRVPLRKFIRAVKEPAVIAFSTTSSEAALPRAMEVLERLGVPRRIVSFVLPLGYSFNLDGTTLYLSLAAVFVAQAAGVELTVGQQVTMLLTLMLTTKGVAGVPRASLVILAGTLASYGLPLEGDHAHPRRRRADGHGADDDQRHRQLPRHGGRRQVGGRVRRGQRRRPAAGGGPGGNLIHPWPLG